MSPAMSALSRWRVVALGIWLCATSACMTLSPGGRPRVLEKGTFRPAVAFGSTRDVTGDFNRAAPRSGSEFEPGIAPFVETALHYGLLDNLDLGARLRPFGPGAKLEAMLQVLDGTWPVEVAIAAGIDGFWRKRSEVLCNEGGDECLYRKYAGAAAGAQLVVAKRLWAGGTLFGGPTYSYLYLDGEQSVEDPGGRYATVTQRKKVREHIGGFMAGLEFGRRRLRITPQVYHYSVRRTDGSYFSVPSVSIDFGLLF